MKAAAAPTGDKPKSARRERAGLFSVGSIYAGWPKGRLIVGTILASGGAVALMPVPLLVHYTIETAIPSGRPLLFIAVAVGMLLSQVLSSGLHMGARQFIYSANAVVISRLRERLVKRILELPLEYYSRQKPSDLHGLVMRDGLRVQQALNLMAEKTLPACVAALGFLMILGWMSLELLGVAMVALVPLLLIAKFFRPRLLKDSGKQRKSESQFNFSLQKLLSHKTMIHLHGDEKAQGEELGGQISSVGDRLRRESMLRMLYQQSQTLALAVFGAIVVAGGAWMVASQKINMGELIGFLWTFNLLRRQLMKASTCLPGVIRGSQAYKAICQSLAGRQRMPYSGQKKLDYAGGLELRGVSFGYSGKPLLGPLDLSLRAGETLVLKGRNGVGKSTLFQLILGFYRPQAGKVLFDGVPIEEIELSSLRKQLGVVPQNPPIMSTTMADNIRCGRPGNLDEAIVLAGLEAFVKAPGGLERVVGEKGARLSGGERQRLALARAVYGRPSLLLLDEADNHLEEGAFENFLALLRRSEYRPSLVIASHKPLSRDLVDIVVVLDLGA